MTLTISGTITMALEAVPGELVLSRMTASERSTAEARFYCYLDKPLALLGHQFSDPATATCARSPRGRCGPRNSRRGRRPAAASWSLSAWDPVCRRAFSGKSSSSKPTLSPARSWC